MTETTRIHGSVPTSRRRKSSLVEGAPVYFLVAMVLGFSLLQPQFFPTRENLVTILNDGALPAVLACGLTLVLVVGEFDLSIAATASFAGALATVLVVQQHQPLAIVIAAVLLSSALIGAINGWLVASLGIPALIATIGTASILDGATLWITGNSVIFSGFTNEFIGLGSWRLFGLQAPFYYLLTLAVLLGLVLYYTVLGRQLYATGGNRAASRMAGIAVERQVVLAFSCCSVLAGLCGLIYTARQGSLTPLFGTSMLLPAYAAAFVGSVTLAKSRFHILGTVIGVYIIGTGTIGLLIVGAPAYSQQLFAGAVLLSATGGARIWQRMGRALRQEKPAGER